MRISRIHSILSTGGGILGKLRLINKRYQILDNGFGHAFFSKHLTDIVAHQFGCGHPELVAEMSYVEIAGVMGMASNVDDEERIREDFRLIRHTFDTLKKGVMSRCDSFTVVSMGMSHDWPIAVSEGADMIRVGTTIFGEREY